MSSTVHFLYTIPEENHVGGITLLRDAGYVSMNYRQLMKIYLVAELLNQISDTCLNDMHSSSKIRWVHVLSL